ncbi:uncharacterized protein [Coffea arabica]|uniref:MULE transposase domain-containing protein n=1 Tax=Coffea arabica TaxID=13443 RepID=A0ABM4UYK1_COFAR
MDSLEPRLTSGFIGAQEYFHGLDSIPSFGDPGPSCYISPHGIESNPGQGCRSSAEDDEGRGLRVNLDTQQPFVGYRVANTECGDIRRNSIAGSSAYVPRGMAFFFDLESIDDDDIEEENGLEHIVTFSEENNNIRLHMRFESKQQLSRAVRMWSINHNREFRVIESKSNTWFAKCKSSIERIPSTSTAPSYPPCDWCVRAVKKKTHRIWQITKWVNDHNYLGDMIRNNNTSLTASVISRNILRSIEDDPGLKVKNILSFVKKNLKVDVSYKKAWYARRKAIELVFGSWEANFVELPQYLDAQVQSNPDTVVEWSHHSDSSDRVNTFKYGKLLVAVTQDANNKILPIAYAILDEETISSWSWFMKQLRYNVALDRHPIYVIFDRHNGIIYTMTHFDYWEEPLTYHRFCLRHVRSNLMTQFKDLHLKRLCWAMGRARQLRKWRMFRRELRSMFPNAWNYLSAINPEKWCLTHDDGRRWGILTTNISESYNNVLRGARRLPIRACIDMTFHRTVALFKTRMEDASHCRNPFPPKI